MWDLTYLFVCHDSFITAGQGARHSDLTSHVSFVCGPWVCHKGGMTHSCVWHESSRSTSPKRSLHRSILTYLYVGCDHVTYRTWHIRLCDMARSYAHSQEARHSDMSWLVLCVCGTWLCDVTHSYVWHVSFIRMRDLPLWHMWHQSFFSMWPRRSPTQCVLRCFIYTWDMTLSRVWNVSVTRMTWLVYQLMANALAYAVCISLSHVSCAPPICVTWLIHRIAKLLVVYKHT